MVRHPQTWEGSQYCLWRGSKATRNAVSPDPCPPPPQHPRPGSPDAHGETSIQSRGVMHCLGMKLQFRSFWWTPGVCPLWVLAVKRGPLWHLGAVTTLIVRSLIDTKLGMACSQSSACQGFSWVDNIGKGAQSRETVLRAEGMRRDEFLLGWGP